MSAANLSWMSLRYLALAAAIVATTVHAQSGEPGAYVGTIDVSGTLIEPQGSYRASAKVTLPVSKVDDDAIEAEFLAGEAPNASVQISEWNTSYTEKSADSDGKFSSWSCSLARPVEIPMMASGVLTVDRETHTHALSISLLSMEDVAFDCTNSRSGAYKKKEGVALVIGTGAPGMQSEHPLPFSDVSRLAASFTLDAGDAAMGNYGPIVQKWDLRLTQ